MKSKTDDLRIINTQELVSPQEIINSISPSERGFATIIKARNQIKNILNKSDNKFMIVVGPCSIHDVEAAKEYAKQPTLAVQQNNTIIASQQSVAGNSGGIFSGLSKAIGGVFGGGEDAQMQNQRAIAAIDQPSPAPAVQPQPTRATTGCSCDLIPHPVFGSRLVSPFLGVKIVSKHKIGHFWSCLQGEHLALPSSPGRLRGSGASVQAHGNRASAFAGKGHEM